MAISIHESFSDFDEAEWNELERGDFVFGDHRFLTALERSGCLGRRTGWHPRIFAARSGPELCGVFIGFDKTNSYGEYIFDWSWANAAAQAGIEYYPKSVGAIPFTPATGSKFLLSRESSVAMSAREELFRAVLSDFKERDVSSLHFLFETADEIERLRERSLLIRHSYQYHWRNRGWKTFEDFLSALRSKRRSEIRRERAVFADRNIRFRRLTGADLTNAHAEIMYAFYLSTIRKMGGHPYLTREFFTDVFLRMKDTILFVLAETPAGDPIAGAINFFRGRSLYGRYWGCIDEYRNLHFEVCYYQAIGWCLERGFELFEAGAQGEHKFNRGFTPHLTFSAHEIKNRQLRSAIADFLESEKVSIDELFAEYKVHDPFNRREAES